MFCDAGSNGSMYNALLCEAGSTVFVYCGAVGRGLVYCCQEPSLIPPGFPVFQPTLRPSVLVTQDISLSAYTGCSSVLTLYPMGPTVQVSLIMVTHQHADVQLK